MQLTKAKPALRAIALPLGRKPNLALWAVGRIRLGAAACGINKVRGVNDGACHPRTEFRLQRPAATALLLNRSYQVKRIVCTRSASSGVAQSRSRAFIRKHSTNALWRFTPCFRSTGLVQRQDEAGGSRQRRSRRDNLIMGLLELLSLIAPSRDRWQGPDRQRNTVAEKASGAGGREFRLPLREFSCSSSSTGP